MTFQNKKPIYTNCKNGGYVILKNFMGEDVKTQVNAARASFGVEIESVTDRDRKLFKTCARDGHTSTMEHNVFTFAFKVPLFVARQHMRHRTWSFNEISRRYTDKNLDFYLPQSFREQSSSNRQASVAGSKHDPILYTVNGSYLNYDYKASSALEIHTNNSLRLYNQMIEQGVSREESRMVLPQNLYTYYWGTVNLNNFFKFYELRNHPGAQAEIQEVAITCYELLKKVIPETTEIYSQALNERKLRAFNTHLKTLNKQELSDIINMLDD
jgi:thymidylate synthase (FAD)